MEPRRGFDDVKHEKEEAIARFNRFRRVARLWRFVEILVFFALVSWSSGRFAAVLKTTGGCLVDFSSYLSNHHVVFLIGNAIIVLLWMLCGQNDASVSGGGGDFCDDYVKHGESTRQREVDMISSTVTVKDEPAEKSRDGGDFCDDYVKYSESYRQREVAMPSSTVTAEKDALAEKSRDGGDFCDDYVEYSDSAQQQEVALPSSTVTEEKDAPEEKSRDSGDICDDYLKYSESAHQREVPLLSSTVTEENDAPTEKSRDGVDDEKQIVVRVSATEAISRSDDVAAVIDKAARKIERFRRTQSEKLKRDISVRPRTEFRRLETINSMKTVCCKCKDTSEIETLSNDEFRRRVEAFIDKHRGSGKTKQIQFGEYEKYRLSF